MGYLLIDIEIVIGWQIDTFFNNTIADWCISVI